MGLSEAGIYVPLNSVRAILFCTHFGNIMDIYFTKFIAMN